VNFDRIRALEPTHVIVNVDENRREDAEALATFVPNVIVTHPLGPEDNLRLYRQIGSAFGKEREAEGLCARFAAVLGSVRAEAFETRKLLYLIWKDPWMTVSRDTYISKTLRLFGLLTVPAGATARYPHLSDLDVGEAELILLSSEPYRFRETHRQEIQGQCGKPVHLIDGEMTSWYGPRAIAGLRYLRDFVRDDLGV
jgi:ABC-type Fe3+-hydroxamate transport system substrate-binding protein